jgi:RNA polymerase sigma factor (sigma-70 family)
MQRRALESRPAQSLASEDTVAVNGYQPDADPQVRAAVAALPERQRLILFLRYYADLDYATIAEALDVSAGTVAATLSNARSSLRRLLPEVRQ